MVIGKVFANMPRFFYNVQQHDFIYLSVVDFCLDEEGLIYLKLDAHYYCSFREILKMYGKHAPSVIPVTVNGDGLSQDSFDFHFDLITKPSMVETISKFEAREYRGFEDTLTISNSQVSFITNKEYYAQNKDTFLSKEGERLRQKKQYDFFIIKELEAIKKKIILQEDEFEKIPLINKKIEQKKRKLKKINL